jgi:hypothetical protein
VGFYDFVARPMFEAIDLLVPMDVPLRNLDLMYDYWRAKFPTEEDMASALAPIKQPSESSDGVSRASSVARDGRKSVGGGGAARPSLANKRLSYSMERISMSSRASKASYAGGSMSGSPQPGRARQASSPLQTVVAGEDSARDDDEDDDPPANSVGTQAPSPPPRQPTPPP